MKNRINLFLIVIISLLAFQCSSDDTTSQQEPETLTDSDGNVYETIKMGNQIWMKENLKTTSFNDGTPISFYTNAEFGNNWGSLNDMMPLYQWASTYDLNNVVDEELPEDYYGAMYNHFAIESGKLAPDGWRIPTKADFEILEDFLASEGHQGNQATVLKTETGWLPNSGVGTNLYDFNALPNGYVSALGTATLGQGICSWVTSNVNGASLGTQTRVTIQLFDQPTFLYANNAIQLGAGIRLIKIQ